MAPAGKKAISKGKTVEKTEKPKTRKAKRHESYSIYIHKVLKEVHDEVGISKRGMAIMESFIGDMFERITVEAGKMCRYGKKSTLSSRDIQSAVRLVLPGELSKHAISEGTKALSKFTSA